VEAVISLSLSLSMADVIDLTGEDDTDVEVAGHTAREAQEAQDALLAKRLVGRHTPATLAMGSSVS
jgi:hypothetical protein